MKPKQKDLIRYLLKQKEPTHAQQIALAINTSIRTVKNYVSDINNGGQQIILSSPHGYSAVPNLAIALLGDKTSTTPQNYSDRVHYIIKKMLIEHQSLNVFDLCENLFISYSTLKAELTKMNKTFRQYNIQVVTHNETLLIQGAEKDKRRLTSAIIFEETSYNFIDLTVLERSFDKQSIIVLETIIKRLFSKYHYYLNDFSFMNLLLHFLILIERVQNGKYLSEHQHIVIENTHESNLVKELCVAIESSFAVHLNANETSEIYILLKTNTNYNLTSNFSELKEIVSNDVLEMTQDVAQSIFAMYAINLNNDTFIIPFALHLDNLLVRVRQHKLNKKPLLHSIRTNCSIIYEIAIFVSIKLADEYDIHINEDEIAFLALHIGTEIERQKVNQSKLKCILLCPDYMGLESKLYNQLLLNFNNDITIIKTISQLNQIDDTTFDLLFSTIEMPPTIDYNVIVISPFHFANQKSNIYKKIDEARTNAKKQILKQNFDRYFSKELFYSGLEFADKYQLIQQIGSEMEQQGLVSTHYIENVCERENASSTRFDQIAIPHSVYMDAAQTSVAVIVNPKGIPWDNNLVPIVLLIAINSMDKTIFTALYSALVSLFDDPQTISQIKKAANFAAFKKIIHHQM
ncbi:PTS transporter subunit EIIA [Listeria booriae]|uniref:PTS transporter subunit EIIA n=2 Tax=Listeria booriae TaxID=1552123 RepID=A0A842FXN6_9LIST|nr:PTS sugar transporter subunit IIA [Listeria booriae]MBC2291674.1 PTS transporter subunit EIIA [Listeria booriae]